MNPLSQIPPTDFNWAEAVTKHGASSRMSLSVQVDSSRRLKDYFDNVDHARWLLPLEGKLKRPDCKEKRGDIEPEAITVVTQERMAIDSQLNTKICELCARTNENWKSIM